MDEKEKAALAWAVNFISKIGVRNPQDAAYYIGFAAYAEKMLKQEAPKPEEPKKD